MKGGGVILKKKRIGKIANKNSEFQFRVWVWESKIGKKKEIGGKFACSKYLYICSFGIFHLQLRFSMTHEILKIISNRHL